MKKGNNMQSKFVKYCLTVTSCLLLLCVSYTFIVFKTDSVVNIDKQSAYNPVNFDRTDVQTIISEVEEEENSPGGSGGSNPPPGTPQTTLPFTSNGEWYDFTSGPSIAKETTPSINLTIGTTDATTGATETVGLYSGVPWDPSAIDYIFDVRTAAQDVVDYVDTQSGDSCGITPKSAFVFEFSFNSAKDNVKAVDGVESLGVALQPSVYDSNYCNAFTKDDWKTKSTCDASLYNKKVCVILQHKTSRNVYYLPTYKGDSKAHTWPGGVMQTHCKVKGFDSTSNIFTVDIGDKGRRDAQLSFIDLIPELDKVVSSAEPSKLRDYWKINVEICYIKSDTLNMLNNEYDVVGFVVWK